MTHMNETPLALVDCTCDGCERPIFLLSDHVGMKLCINCAADYEAHIDEMTLDVEGMEDYPWK